MATSIVLAHPSNLACETLSRGLSGCRGKFHVLGWAVDATEALKLVIDHHPDVALITAALQDGPEAGFKVLRELRISRHSTPVIVLVDSSEQHVVLHAFSAGAKGVLFKTDGFSVVCKCIRCVHAGQIWASSGQMQIIVEALAERGPLSVLDVEGRPLLTKREEAIVRMVAEGLPNLQVSSALRLSPHTVKNHLFHIYEKLGVSNRVELILYALSSSSRRATSQPPTGSA
jgi:DNA-binding NarL/FixJ family response regulator